MIPKDAYVFFCIDKNGKEQIHYPDLTYISGHRMSQRETQYIFDYKEAEKYISDHLVGKFEKILIAKVMDLVTVKVSSVYKDQK